MKNRNSNRHYHGLSWFALRRFVALVLALLMLVPANIVSVFAEGAQSDGKTPVCGLEAHTHTEACYEEKLACGETERDPVTETRRVYVGQFEGPHAHEGVLQPRRVDLRHRGKSVFPRAQQVLLR